MWVAQLGFKEVYVWCHRTLKIYFIIHFQFFSFEANRQYTIPPNNNRYLIDFSMYSKHKDLSHLPDNLRTDIDLALPTRNTFNLEYHARAYIAPSSCYRKISSLLAKILTSLEPLMTPDDVH